MLSSIVQYSRVKVRQRSEVEKLWKSDTLFVAGAGSRVDSYCEWGSPWDGGATSDPVIISSNLVPYYSEIQTKISSLKDAEWSNLESGWGHLRGTLDLFYYVAILHILIVWGKLPAKVKRCTSRNFKSTPPETIWNSCTMLQTVGLCSVTINSVKS